ncbi:hypothetical protein U1Q18_018747 [Sarracenia purpurea var. burkii]
MVIIILSTILKSVSHANVLFILTYSSSHHPFLAQYLKGLKKEMLEEIPFVTDLLEELHTKHTASPEGPQHHEAPNYSGDANIDG